MGEISFAAIKAGLTVVVIALLLGWLAMDHWRNRPERPARPDRPK
jgi:hypothetical protein